MDDMYSSFISPAEYRKLEHRRNDRNIGIFDFTGHMVLYLLEREREREGLELVLITWVFEL